MAAASVPSTAALPRPGTRPLYTPARGGSRIPPGGGPGALCPLRPLARSPRSARGARSARLEREAVLGSRPGRDPAPAAAPRSARGWTRRAASGFRVGRRRHDAGGGRAAAAAPPGGARGAAAGPLSCALALQLLPGLRGPGGRRRARGGRSPPAEEAAGWACGAGSVRTPAERPLLPGRKRGRGGGNGEVGGEETPEAVVRLRKEARGTAALRCQESGDLERSETLVETRAFLAPGKRTWTHCWPPPKGALQ